MDNQYIPVSTLSEELALAQGCPLSHILGDGRCGHGGTGGDLGSVCVKDIVVPLGRAFLLRLVGAESGIVILSDLTRLHIMSVRLKVDFVIYLPRCCMSRYTYQNPDRSGSNHNGQWSQ